MRRFTFTVGLTAAGLALAAMPVLAGQRPNTDGGSPASDRGTAVDRPATSGSPAGGGVASGGGGGAVGGGSSSGSSSPSGAGASSPSFSGADRVAPAMDAPQHRRGGGSEGTRGGDRAVPRSGGSSGSGDRTRTGGSTSSIGSSNDSDAPQRAVPSWSRPRGDQPATGTAVDRTHPPYTGGGGGYRGRYYDPYYPYFGYGYPGYGFGLGLGFYDPFFYNPWMYGGYGYGGYGYGGYAGGADDYTPYNSGAQSGYSTGEEGSVRLKVKPRDAKVYVDGYFVGTIDSFDGTFQKLKLTAGHHRLEVKADGFESAEFDVLVTPGQTLTYQGDLKRQ